MSNGSKTRHGTSRRSWTFLWLLAIIPFSAIMIMINLSSVAQDQESMIDMEQKDLPRRQVQQGSKSTSSSTMARSHQVPPQPSTEIQWSGTIPQSNERQVKPELMPRKSKQQTSHQTAVVSKEPLLAVKVTNNTRNTPTRPKKTETTAAATPKAAPIKSRIFLGIFFSGDADQLRNVHRKTYLNYFAKHHTSTPHRTCTLREFQALLQTAKDPSPLFENDSEACRLVYVFILDGTETWKQRRLQKVLEREPDVLILNPETYPVPPSPIPSWVRWYQFAMDQHHQWAEQRPHPSNAGVVEMAYFDFVAHTDCSVQLRPEEFWKDNPILNALPGHRSKIFAQGNEFTLLSMDLVQNAVVPQSKKLTVTTAAEDGNDGTSDWLLDILRSHLPLPATPQPLAGMTRFPNMAKQDSWLSLLFMWDEYKDQKLEESAGYSNPQEAEQVQTSKAYDYLRSTNHTVPRLLIGIFTMDRPKDRIRRDTIRETYLSYYKESNTPHRICAVSDLTRRILTPEQGAQCQLAYAFVMGSNPNGTKSLLEPSSSNPIIVDEKDLPPHLLEEKDVVHLNIHENMERGKSPTWIRFATDFVYEQFYFDYIGKMDSDTLLLPDEFLDEVLTQRCPPFPNNIRVFGGGPAFNPWQNKMIGPMYMGGKIYWMSPDLGRFVTSKEFKVERESVDTGAEDWAMGNFVHSHPWPIRRVMFKRKFEGQEHPVKEPEEMQSKWKTYVKKRGRKQ